LQIALHLLVAMFGQQSCLQYDSTGCAGTTSGKQRLGLLCWSANGAGIHVLPGKASLG
jgi:hypothetical protein